MFDIGMYLCNAWYLKFLTKVGVPKTCGDLRSSYLIRPLINPSQPI